MDDGSRQKEFVHRILEAYRRTPGTMGTVRRPDRLLAEQLYQRGVSVTVIENALVQQRRAVSCGPLTRRRWLRFVRWLTSSR